MPEKDLLRSQELLHERVNMHANSARSSGLMTLSVPVEAFELKLFSEIHTRSTPPPPAPNNVETCASKML